MSLTCMSCNIILGAVRILLNTIQFKQNIRSGTVLLLMSTCIMLVFNFLRKQRLYYHPWQTWSSYFS